MWLEFGSILYHKNPHCFRICSTTMCVQNFELHNWFFFQSLPTLTEKEPVQNQPIWGQFHFIPNGSISIGTNYLVQTPYNTSYTTLGTVSALYSGALDPPQAPVVLMPSSYDLSPKENEGDERCFTLILISGSLVLLATVSASLGFSLGIF